MKQLAISMDHVAEMCHIACCMFTAASLKHDTCYMKIEPQEAL